MEEPTQDIGNIIRIDINMDDVSTMSALVVGLIGMITVKSGGILPPEILNSLKLIVKVPSPRVGQQDTQQVIRVPPTQLLSMVNKHDLMDGFIRSYCCYGEGLRIKSTDMRVKFNQSTGLNESHVSFAKLMDSYYGEHHIEKIQRSDGKWYNGIGWIQQETVMIPPMQ